MEGFIADEFVGVNSGAIDEGVVIGDEVFGRFYFAIFDLAARGFETFQ